MSKEVAASVTTPEGAHIVDFSQMPTRADVAEMFGVSVTAVRKWEKQGKLHSINDAEGTARFALKEIRELQAEKDGGLATTPPVFDEGEEDEALAAAARARHPMLGGMLHTDQASLELSVVGKLLNLILIPRQKIDDMMFRMLEASHNRNAVLEQRINQMTDAVQQAEDRTAERQALAQQVKTTEDRTTLIWNRLTATFDKLVNKGGVPFLHSLSNEQLEAFLESPESFRPEQLEALKGEDARRKALLNPVTNGVNSKGATTSGGEAAS